MLKNETKTINAFSVNVETERKLNVLSLFSGCGGMDLGFVGNFNFLSDNYAQNPFNIVFANDIFKQASDVYEDNFNHTVCRTSIDELDINELPNVNIDIILGGFPCQAFSYAGNRGGLSDKRGQLYLEMIRVINHYQPKMFVAENVDGIRNSRKNMNGDNVDASALDTILGDFEKAGYDVKYHVLTATDYGVPQIRRRVIIMGIRKNLGNVNNIFFPEQLFDETGEITGRKWRTSTEGIDDIWNKVNDPLIPNHTTRDISKAKFYPGKKMQGNNKIFADKPAPTIRAEHHGNIEAHYRTTLADTEDMAGWRRLSVRECARLQSFPDTYIFTASASSSYKMIGNAVPPVMAWHVARAVYHTLSQLNQE